MPDPAWFAQARCRGVDPAVMFPVDLPGVVGAKRVCDDCPVSAPCLEHALRNREAFGVWGGASERERRRIARRRRWAS